MKLFWILWCIDFGIALVVVYYFVVGLFDGTVSSNNGKMWAILLVALIGLLWGTHFLKTLGKFAVANTLLSILAVPGLLFLLYMFIAIVTKARWN